MLVFAALCGRYKKRLVEMLEKLGSISTETPLNTMRGFTWLVPTSPVRGRIFDVWGDGMTLSRLLRVRTSTNLCPYGPVDVGMAVLARWNIRSSCRNSERHRPAGFLCMLVLIG
jgi:hypothetical protein